MTDVQVSMRRALGKGYNRFFHSRNFYRVVKGGRGSKKSKSSALCFIHDILKYKWANLLVVRRFSNTNKQSTYTDLKWAANRLGVTHLFKFNESLPEITVKATGQKILFRGLDDPLKITSITVDTGLLSWLWLEEAYQVENQDKFETLVESIRGSVDEPDFFKQITVTFNPWSERHWLKSAFFDEDTKKKDVFADTTTYRVNEWLDQQDIDRYEDLWRTNPRRAAVVANGDWGVAEGLVFENVKLEEFDKDELLKDKNNKLSLGLDFGFTHDPTALVACLINNETNKIYVFDEAYQTGLITRQVADLIKTKGYSKTTIIADSAEPRLIEELKSEHGLRRIKASRKGKDSIMAGVSKLQGYQIIVHPDCTHIMDEFYSYCYQQDKEGNWLNKPEDKNNHLMDALRYALQCVETKKWLV